MEGNSQVRAPHEAGQAASESSMAGEPTSNRRSETAMTNNKHTTPQIPMKDFYTVQDVAILLGTGVNRVRELANRKVDPLPFRCFAGIARGMFINRIDLADWVKRNTTLVSERKARDPGNGKR